MVDPTKIVVIVNLEVPENIKQLRPILGHTVYYGKFIQGYALITTPMENLMMKDETFCWDEYFQICFEFLKENIVTAPILVFPDCSRAFHVHVDASNIALGVVLAQ